MGHSPDPWDSMKDFETWNTEVNTELQRKMLGLGSETLGLGTKVRYLVTWATIHIFPFDQVFAWLEIAFPFTHMCPNLEKKIVRSLSFKTISWFFFSANNSLRKMLKKILIRSDKAFRNTDLTPSWKMTFKGVRLRPGELVRRPWHNPVRNKDLTGGSGKRAVEKKLFQEVFRRWNNHRLRMVEKIKEVTTRHGCNAEE